ncbi:MAG: hypothetical protein HN580_14615 [Deltaproteobacteria bacterium]|jgi:hypothetical protein|nr:hypothetical protein [Deltaproteobacteria bacterium]MBT4090388.1 hypothetical protein [Deltaproteobacteria bacterium]MBT4263571.1 hypothetical protein [Deltaproteobacteria bacterium]MBT4644350.1 hypothetical protein [Deltaproteobacteria bacterium]MBT6500431.1 hypothetical protein [Deltaproteobacteria bacterium]
MNSYVKWFVTTLICCLMTTPALADLRVGVEFPLSYSFKTADDGSSLDADGKPSGYILLAQLPFFSGGAGLESYEIKLDQTGSHKISLLMADLFYTLPVPVVNISVGVGYGTVEVGGDNASRYDKTDCSQYFFRLGVPLGELFELIGSYHNVFAKVKVNGNDTLLEAGGTLTTVGVAIGF